MIGAERHAGRSAAGECYLLTAMQYPTRVPRFRLPAPLRGSTPRQLWALALTVALLCRSAQNDTVGGFLRGLYNVNLLKYHCNE